MTDRCLNCGKPVNYYGDDFCSSKCWAEWSRAALIRSLGADLEPITSSERDNRTEDTDETAS